MTDRLPVILIVDDEPLNLQHLAGVLASDYLIKVASNGLQAMELARREPYPEVILLDVMMPGMDGYQVCAALKSDPLTRATPVLFITAKTDAASESAGLAAGAVDFINKPINPEVVRARVHLQHELAQHRQHLEGLVHARTKELAQARDAAESANRAKSAFLSAVSHEMNTPLHQISGFALVLQRALPEGDARRQLGHIAQATRNLQDLVKRLLDFTALESGDLRLTPRAFDPRVWLAQATTTQRSMAAARGLHLIASVDADMPAKLIGDADCLSQVLAQLIDNAIKFSDQGSILIRLRVGDRQNRRLVLRIEIVDEGRGFDGSRTDRLFEQFVVDDDSSTRQHGGLGIGLALCQRLVKLMSGEIHLSSAPGRGTAASVSVPLDIAAETSEAASTA